jgi:hypothetical protein
MTTTSWHAGPELLAAYASGSLDAVNGASVEQHLMRCTACRAAIRSHVDPHPLERAWAGVRDAVETTSQPMPIRLARRLGLPEPASVLLAATASLRTAWLAGAFVAIGFATLAVSVAGGRYAIAPFLLVAPMVPVLGVAAAYGPHQDPLESLIITAPYGRTRLILVRTLAVLVSVLPFTALLGLMLPGPPWLAAAWLGPALGLVPMLLALSSFVGPRAGASILTIAWSGVVLLSAREMSSTWLVESGQQVAYLGLALVAALVLVVRSRRDRQIGAVL